MRLKSTTGRAAARRAFTMVELMVVIGIILLLAGILVPTVSSALKMGHKAACQSRIVELNDGCTQFKSDTKYYPGQRNPDWPGTMSGAQSGAQVLAKAMFWKDPSTATSGPVSHYASYKTEDMLDGSENAAYLNTISDRFPRDKRPIAYYPSRVNMSGLSQFVVGDNENITGTWAGFNTDIQDSRFGVSGVPYMDGEFLLIGPGVNREYVDPSSDRDNLVNWNE